MNAPRVVGVDISLTASGVADNTGWCTKVGREGVLKLPLHDRTEWLVTLAEEVCARIFHPVLPALVVLEASASAQAYGGASERAGLWWLVVHILRDADIPCVEVSPSQVKLYALGRGGGKDTGKGAVIEAVTRRWPQFLTRGDDNLADAAVLAAMGADYLGHALAPVPAKHREALAKVKWPEVR